MRLDNGPMPASASCFLFKLLYEVEDEYKIPLRQAIWLWFLGNVAPFPCRHAGYVFGSPQFPEWLTIFEDKQYAVSNEIQRLCNVCCGSTSKPLPFRIEFTSKFGVHVISLTSQYNLLHETLNRDFFPIPPNIVERVH